MDPYALGLRFLAALLQSGADGALDFLTEASAFSVVIALFALVIVGAIGFAVCIAVLARLLAKR